MATTDMLQMSARSALMSASFLVDVPLALRSTMFMGANIIPGISDQVVAITDVIRTSQGSVAQPFMFVSVFMCVTVIVSALLAMMFAMLESKTNTSMIEQKAFSASAMTPMLVICALFAGLTLAYSKKHHAHSPQWMGRVGSVMCDAVFLIPLVGVGLTAGRKIMDPATDTSSINTHLGSLLVGSGVFAATHMLGMAAF